MEDLDVACIFRKLITLRLMIGAEHSIDEYTHRRKRERTRLFGEDLFQIGPSPQRWVGLFILGVAA